MGFKEKNFDIEIFSKIFSVTYNLNFSKTFESYPKTVHIDSLISRNNSLQIRLFIYA